MELTYSWRDGSRVKADPSDAAKVFETIVKRDGALTPQAVVAASKKATAPLHGCFEWDNERAGEAYRMDQARYLIRSHVIIYRQNEGAEPETSRSFVSLSELRMAADETEYSYRPVTAILKDDVMRSAYLASILREIESFKRRYASINELAAVLDEMDKASAVLRQSIGRLTPTERSAVSKAPSGARQTRQPAMTPA